MCCMRISRRHVMKDGLRHFPVEPRQRLQWREPHVEGACHPHMGALAGRTAGIALALPVDARSRPDHSDRGMSRASNRPRRAPHSDPTNRLDVNCLAVLPGGSIGAMLELQIALLSNHTRHTHTHTPSVPNSSQLERRGGRDVATLGTGTCRDTPKGNGSYFGPLRHARLDAMSPSCGVSTPSQRSGHTC